MIAMTTSNSISVKPLPGVRRLSRREAGGIDRFSRELHRRESSFGFLFGYGTIIWIL